MQYILKRTRYDRGLRMTFVDGKDFVVTAGRLETMENIEKFVHSHRRWARNRLERQKHKEGYMALAKDTDHILLHGKIVPVEYVSEGYSHFDGKKLIMLECKDRAGSLILWYHRYAIWYLQVMYEKFANNAYPLVIKDVKSYYGLCVHKKKNGIVEHQIVLNIQLVRADDECIEHVIKHELTHVKVPNHSKKFYEELAKIEPDHRARQAKLKKLELL